MAEFNMMKNISNRNSDDKTNDYLCADNTLCANVNSQDILQCLELKGYVNDFKLTTLGEAEMSLRKVKNAVILAAGNGELSQKAVYSLPKGLYRINGEPIIERQINQLKTAGIESIYVVVGIKKEHYFYLEDKYGVEILASHDSNKGNICSIISALKYLDNTYICNCDNYFEENPFETYEYRAFHATQDKDNTFREYSVSKNMDARITGISIIDKPAECLFGHAYFDRDFSEKFRYHLQNEINTFRTDVMFWQEFYYKHITDLDLYTKKYRKGFIHEFDSIIQLQEIDSLFIENVSVMAIDQICKTLCCTKADIENVMLSPKGLSNLITTFSVFGKEYVLRFPGIDSSIVFNRNKEVIIQKIAYENNIDNTYIHIDESGLKIARFVPNCVDISALYYEDMSLMKRLVEKVRSLHRVELNEIQKETLRYNPIEAADELLKEACKTKGNLFEMFANMHNSVTKLFTQLEKDGIDKVVSHNDINPANILLNNDSFEIIDWEFGGYCDPAFDFGRIIDGYDFTDNRIDELLEVYFERKPTLIERNHWIGYVAIHGWYYFCWALYKESVGFETLFWMHYFYKRINNVLRYLESN